MRQETITVCSFDELSGTAKEYAMSRYREHNDEIFWQCEILDSLMSLLKTANVKINDYSLGLNHSYLKLDIDDDIAQLSGKRAIAWLENNLLSKLRITRAEYLAKRKDYVKYGKSYRIGCVKPCPFTGYCADDDYIDSLKADINAGNDLGDCFRWLANKYSELLQQEYEY